MINKPAYVSFWAELLDLAQLSDWEITSFRTRLKNHLDRLCKALLKDEPISFSTLFSRITYLNKIHRVDYADRKQLNAWRGLLKENKPELFNPHAELALISRFTSYYTQEEIPVELASFLPKSTPIPEQITTTQRKTQQMRVEVLDMLWEEQYFTIIAEDADSKPLRVKFNVPEKNQAYTGSLRGLWSGAQLNLIDVIWEDDETLIPTHFILEPDYLLDVSNLAECFSNFGNSSLFHFLRKFEDTTSSKALLLGNLANLMLDEILHSNTTPEFKALLLQSFRQAPFEYTTCVELQEAGNFQQFQHDALQHFNHILSTITEQFPKIFIDPNQAILEPSFISERFGIQGRLDLLQTDCSDRKTKIIELKSGRLPFPEQDHGKINPNHEAQTNLYRMLIQSALTQKADQIIPMIFYSKAEKHNLRFAPPMLQKEQELMNMRNMVVTLEHQLAFNPDEAYFEKLLDILSPHQFLKPPPFFVQKIDHFKNTVRALHAIEFAYFDVFTRFVAREQFLARTGNTDQESASSISSLWLRNFQEKKERYEILYDLQVTQSEAHLESRTLHLTCVAETLYFSNFRKGDLCILYKRNHPDQNVLNQQVYKCTLVSISGRQVTVKFRFKQKNQQLFTAADLWAIEPDYTDATYTAMYKSMFHWAAAPPQTRAKIIGLIPPELPTHQTFALPPVSEQMQNVLNKALQSRDHFFLVGPPGTGKTSIFLKNLVTVLHQQTNQNILILAYTNRAVDEICAAVYEGLYPKGWEPSQPMPFVRIGSETSTQPLFHPFLLDKLAQAHPSRAALTQAILAQRVYIATVAAMAGKQELLRLKNFDTLIVDEASQVLEPQLIGILTQVKRRIFVGDHNQLPAIVLQSAQRSQVKNDQLHALELQNMRHSYFERMLKLMIQRQYHYAWDMLTYQGRMHEDLAEFPNQQFYKNKLTLACPDWQHAPFEMPDITSEHAALNLIKQHRQLFFNTPRSSLQQGTDKMNMHEAYWAAQIALFCKQLRTQNTQPFDIHKTIGIITPYRNQIAAIRTFLEQTQDDELAQITVDTVERYQGSQRDIIIISFCMNRPWQLQQMASWNEDETVDRKLNVALTRARHQLILLGNQPLLSQTPLYAQLIEQCAQTELPAYVSDVSIAAPLF